MEVERYRIGQDELNRLYQIAEYRKKNRPDMAERFQAILRGCTYYRSEKDALAVALEKVKNKNYRCLICVGYKKRVAYSALIIVGLSPMNRVSYKPQTTCALP